MVRRVALSAALVAAAASASDAPSSTASIAAADARPNIMWMHVESTDGRLYNDDSPVPIAHIRSVQQRGVNFVNFYANVPICCPSRASVWSGRQPHNIPHQHNNYSVIGALSNYEGLGLENTTWDRRKLSDQLQRGGYDIGQGPCYLCIRCR